MIADTLLAGTARTEFLATLAQDCRDIAGILHTVELIRSASQPVRDLIAGYGEIWSTRLFSAYLRARAPARRVKWIDARDIVSVEWGPLGSGRAMGRVAGELGRSSQPDSTGTLIITGFIARDPQGLQTTLGRNGSDFSGSIFGALLEPKKSTSGPMSMAC